MSVIDLYTWTVPNCETPTTMREQIRPSCGRRVIGTATGVLDVATSSAGAPA